MKHHGNDCHVSCVLALIGGLVALSGCGSDMPFDLVPVHGKVTYEDGSLIPADKIVVTFNPVNPERQQKLVAPGGQTEVNVADGAFSGVSSRWKDDGLVKRRHKVVVVSYSDQEGKLPVRNRAVPPRYHQESTTPLEVEVTSRNQFIEIKVDKR